MNTKQVGDVSVSAFITWCLTQGANVSIPFGDRLPYDLIIDVAGKLLKIQVKTGWLKPNGTLAISAKSVTTKNGKVVKKDYANLVDFIIGFDRASEKFYYFKPTLVKDTMTLRFDLPDSGQIKGINLAKDFELDNINQLI